LDAWEWEWDSSVAVEIAVDERDDGSGEEIVDSPLFFRPELCKFRFLARKIASKSQLRLLGIMKIIQLSLLCREIRHFPGDKF
jgi:hypothetical protein